VKKILIGLAVLAVIAAGAVLLLLGSLDKIVKRVIESSGSELMGVPVTVASVDIKLSSGAGRITGLRIANPAGYTRKDAFRMDLINLDLSLKSLTGSPLVIDELTIDSPVLNLEMKKDGGSNLEDLLAGINRNEKQADRKAAAEETRPGKKDEKKSAAPGEPTRLAFGKIVIRGVTVNVIRDDNRDKPKSMTLPPLELRDVGGKTGVTPARLGAIVFGGIIKSALEDALKQAAVKEIDKAALKLFGELDKDKKRER